MRKPSERREAMRSSAFSLASSPSARPADISARPVPTGARSTAGTRPRPIFVAWNLSEIGTRSHTSPPEAVRSGCKSRRGLFDPGARDRRRRSPGSSRALLSFLLLPSAIRWAGRVLTLGSRGQARRRSKAWSRMSGSDLTHAEAATVCGVRFPACQIATARGSAIDPQLSQAWSRLPSNPRGRRKTSCSVGRDADRGPCAHVPFSVSGPMRVRRQAPAEWYRRRRDES
jgi:hypothetical protein